MNSLSERYDAWIRARKEVDEAYAKLNEAHRMVRKWAAAYSAADEARARAEDAYRSALLPIGKEET